MKSHFIVLASLVLLPTALLAQGSSTKPPKRFAGDSHTTAAIGGFASSGRHCVGRQGASVHSLGWFPANSRVQIAFSSDFDPVASVTNVQLGSEAPDLIARSSYWSDDDSGGNLDPQFNITTSFAGTLVLHVGKFSAEGAVGCYSYKVETLP